MSDSKKTCFVVTPIGNAESPIRRHIDGIINQAITPALGDKYDIDVAHRKYEIGSINDRVIKSIYNSDLIIANLTGLNPNVMFELAIRYSFGKPAIVIAEEGTKLPFDIIDENTIFYINDPAGADDLKNKLIEFERNIHFGKDNYGPIVKAIKTIPIYNAVEKGENITSEQFLPYIIERLDIIENRISSQRYGVRRYDVFYDIQAEKELTDDERKNILDRLISYKGVTLARFLSDSRLNIEIHSDQPYEDVQLLGLKITGFLRDWGIKCLSVEIKPA